MKQVKTSSNTLRGCDMIDLGKIAIIVKKGKEVYDLGKVIMIRNDWDSGKLATDKGVEIHWHGRFIPQGFKNCELVLQVITKEKVVLKK